MNMNLKSFSLLNEVSLFKITQFINLFQNALNCNNSISRYFCLRNGYVIKSIKMKSSWYVYLFIYWLCSILILRVLLFIHSILLLIEPNLKSNHLMFSLISIYLVYVVIILYYSKDLSLKLFFLNSTILPFDLILKGNHIFFI